MEDGEILELLYNHSEKGLEMTRTKYNRLLLSISKGVLSDDGDAEECVNDTYLKIWSIIPPYRPPHFRSFLCKIARQISVDRFRSSHLKKHDINQTISLNELDEDFPDESITEAETTDLSDAINRFLASADIESRTLFVRRYFIMESQAELAKRFEITENSVNVKLFRIRGKLKKYLSERGYIHEKQ